MKVAVTALWWSYYPTVTECQNFNWFIGFSRPEDGRRRKFSDKKTYFRLKDFLTEELMD